MRQIEVSVDVFAEIWSSRLAHEKTESEILTRLLQIQKNLTPDLSSVLTEKDRGSAYNEDFGHANSKPKTKRWTDVLIWTLAQFGGKAKLEQIYLKSREGRRALRAEITREHDASARECLEAHCQESAKYRGKANLFFMPEGKGAGVWALRG